MPSITFQDCTCPSCKAKLDDVPEKAQACPACNRPLEREKVWATRNYRGTVVLPPWIVAFTWPMALMLIGVGMFFYFRSYGHTDFFVPGVVFATGMVFFFLKLSSGGK